MEEYPAGQGGPANGAIEEFSPGPEAALSGEEVFPKSEAEEAVSRRES